MWESIKSFVVFYILAYPAIAGFIIGTIIISLVRALWMWWVECEEFWESFFMTVMLSVVGSTLMGLIIIFYRWLIPHFT